MPGDAIVTIGARRWAVALATTPAELVTGLGGLPLLPRGSGMLFDPSASSGLALGVETILHVTTEPMLFPIDIVFIGANLVVVEVVPNVPPGRLVASSRAARYFLEVNPGEAAGVNPGDRADVQVVQPAVAPPLPSALDGLLAPMVNLMVSAAALNMGMGLLGRVVRGAIPRRQSLPPIVQRARDTRGAARGIEASISQMGRGDAA